MQAFISVISLVSALLLSQAPEFTQQYLQRLGGAVDELERILRHFDEDSGRSGYERSAALSVMANNSDRLVRDQAARMDENIRRFNRLRQHQAAMGNAGAIGRFATLITSYDPELAERTWSSYTAGLSLEGMVFAVVGFFGTYFVLLAGAASLRQSREAEG